MAVKPAELENRERDLDLANREPAPIRPIQAPRVSGAAEELREIKERVAAARRRKPPASGHCRDCYMRGGDAVLDLIEDKG
jgi:hypothetical protein